jgi:hypothetical protein
MAQTVASPNLASGLPIGPTTPGWWQLFHFANNPLAVIDKAHRLYGNAFTLDIAGYGRFVMLSDPEAVRDIFRGDPDIHDQGAIRGGRAGVSAGSGPLPVLVSRPAARGPLP